METVHPIVMAFLIVGFPAFAIWNVGKLKWLSWLSPVLQCYLFGVILANLPIDIVVPGVSKTLMMASVPLAIPLLLFSTNFPAWMRLARRTVIAQDTDGRILLLVAPEGNLTLHQLSAFLTDSDMNLDIAINLDGGPSSGILLAQPDQKIPAISPLPVVITIATHQ